MCSQSPDSTGALPRSKRLSLRETNPIRPSRFALRASLSPSDDDLAPARATATAERSGTAAPRCRVDLGLQSRAEPSAAAVPLLVRRHGPCCGLAARRRHCSGAAAAEAIAAATMPANLGPHPQLLRYHL